MAKTVKKKTQKLRKRWVRYLSDGRLSEDEIQRRAKQFAREKRRLPNGN